MQRIFVDTNKAAIYSLNENSKLKLFHQFEESWVLKILWVGVGTVNRSQATTHINLIFRTDDISYNMVLNYRTGSIECIGQYTVNRLPKFLSSCWRAFADQHERCGSRSFRLYAVALNGNYTTFDQLVVIDGMFNHVKVTTPWLNVSCAYETLLTIVVNVLKQYRSPNRAKVEVFSQSGHTGALYIQDEQTLFYDNNVDFIDFHSIDLPLVAVVCKQSLVDADGESNYNTDIYVVGIYKRFVLIEKTNVSDTCSLKLYGLCQNNKACCLLDQLSIAATIRGYMYFAERNHLLSYTSEKENLIIKFESDKIEIVSKSYMSDAIMDLHSSFVLPDLFFLQETATVLNANLINPLILLVQEYLVFK